MKALRKLRFHIALYINFFSNREFPVRRLSKEEIEDKTELPSKLDIFFWTPRFTPGAKVIVHDVIPALATLVDDLGLDWSVEFGETIPEKKLDHLICFKSVPTDQEFHRHGQVTMLICDQAEVFWDYLPRFGDIVATSSLEFANLVAVKNRRTTLIEESEPVEYIELGKDILVNPPSKRGNVILWHGGQYSLEPLLEMRAMLEEFSSRHSAQLHIVSGSQNEKEECWGKLKVSYFPWSTDRLAASAKEARLSIIPAKKSIKLSYLKPASRIRCMFALGVPAVGDSGVPEVSRFLEKVDGLTATKPDEWLEVLEELWVNSDRLDAIAEKGSNLVRSDFTTRQTANQWIRYFTAEARRSN